MRFDGGIPAAGLELTASICQGDYMDVRGEVRNSGSRPLTRQLTVDLGALGLLAIKSTRVLGLLPDGTPLPCRIQGDRLIARVTVNARRAIVLALGRCYDA